MIIIIIASQMILSFWAAAAASAAAASTAAIHRDGASTATDTAIDARRPSGSTPRPAFVAAAIVKSHFTLAARSISPLPSSPAFMTLQILFRPQFKQRYSTVYWRLLIDSGVCLLALLTHRCVCYCAAGSVLFQILLPTHTHTHTHTQRQINIRAWFFGFFLVRFVEHLLRWLFVTVIQISNHSSRLIQPFKVITGFLWDFPGIFPEFFLENFLEIFQYCSGVFFRIFLGFFGDFRGIFPYQFPILFPFQLTCFSIFFSWLFRNLFQDFSRIFRDFLGISQRFFRDFSGIFPYQLPILFLFLTKNFQQFFFQDYSKFITRFFLEFPNHFPWNFPAFSGFFWGCFFGNFFPEIFSELFQEFRPGFLEDCGPL